MPVQFEKTHLPEDFVLTEFLTRLPVRELIRWQYVCKLWLHTVSRDCDFAVEQWRHSASGAINSSNQNIVFIGCPGLSCNLIAIPTNSKNGGADSLAFTSNHIGILAAYLRGFKPYFSTPVSAIWNKNENPHCKFVVYDSLHGLLLFLVFFPNAGKSASFFYVCNLMFPPGSGVRFPLMDTCLLEKPLDIIKNGVQRRYVLAFDPALSANRFKIVTPFLRCEWFNIDQWYNQWGFEVFDSCTGKWAMVEEDKDIIVSHPKKRVDLTTAIFAGGMLYWDQIGFSLSLIRFDPWEEMSGTVALPVLGPVFNTNKKLGRWEDRLTLLSSNMVELDFWVLGESTGWLRLYRLDLKTAVARHLGFFCSHRSFFKLLGGGGAAQEDGGSVVERLFNDYCVAPQWCCTDKVVYLWVEFVEPQTSRRAHGQ